MRVNSIFYINLDRRPDRRAHIETCLIGAPVPPERISAVELLAAPETQGLVMLPPYQGNRAIASIFLSHRKAIESALVKPGDGAAAIIEDDCHFSSDIWRKDLLDGLPPGWQLVLLNPRFRKQGSPDKQPRLPLWARLSPFRERYWRHPLRPGEARLTGTLLPEYVISGAHFLVFRNDDALRTALRLMDSARTLYHVDHFFCKEMPGCYAMACEGLRASGFGSDNR